MAVNGANLQNVFMLLTLEPLLARSPFLVLHVRRNHLVGDALRELSIHSDIDLKKPLKVSPFPEFLQYLISIWQQAELLLRYGGQPYLILPYIIQDHIIIDFFSFLFSSLLVFFFFPQESNHLLLCSHQKEHLIVISD